MHWERSMPYMRVALLVLLLGLPAFSGFKLPPDCGARVLSQSSIAKYQKIRKYLKKSEIHPRLHSCIASVIDQWESEGKLPPTMGATNQEPKDYRFELKDIVFPQEVSPRTDFSTGPFSGVEALKWNQENFFFRRDYHYNWAAFQLNIAMGLSSIAAMQPAVIHHQLGILSNEVAGVSLEDQMGFGFDFPALEKLVDEGAVDAASLSEVEGFHFLVGDEDGRSGNFILTPGGKVVGWDFDYAFTQGFVWNAGSPSYIGHIFPLLYTPRFIDGLNRLTDAVIDQSAAVLPLPTRRQVAFRRDLMKADIQNRGEKAVLRDQTFPLDRRRE